MRAKSQNQTTRTRSLNTLIHLLSHQNLQTSTAMEEQKTLTSTSTPGRTVRHSHLRLMIHHTLRIFSTVTLSFRTIRLTLTVHSTRATALIMTESSKPMHPSELSALFRPDLDEMRGGDRGKSRRSILNKPLSG